MTRSALAVLAAVFVFVVADARPTQAAGPDGKALFAAKCALCHGKDGVPPPAFAQKKVADMTAPAWQKSRTDAQIRKGIVEGVPGTMMRGFGTTLKPADIDAIIAHIRTLAAKK